MTNLNSAVIYARTNTMNSNDYFFGSIKEQYDAMRDWAKSQNHNVIGNYKDECTYGCDEVPEGLLRLLNDITNSKIKIKYLIVCQESVIKQNPIISYWFDMELKPKGVELITLGEDLKSEPNKQHTNKDSLLSANFMQTFHEVINEHFKNRLSKRSAYGLNDIAKQGFFTGGRPPFGYKSVTVVIKKYGIDRVRKTLQLHLENAKTVKKIFKLYLSEKLDGPFNAHKISLYLNENNILKDGNKWTALSVKRVISSTIYQGKLEYGRNRLRSDLCNEIIVIPIPPIISKKDFDQVQHKLTKRGKRVHYTKKRKCSPYIVSI